MEVMDYEVVDVEMEVGEEHLEGPENEDNENGNSENASNRNIISSENVNNENSTNAENIDNNVEESHQVVELESDDEDESKAKKAKETPLNESDTDTDQVCPICMDTWTSSGEHRLCCLRCGHLFGYNCIYRWLQSACTAGNRRCPQCNKKAAVKDIRNLYAKKLVSIDTAELDKLKEQLAVVTNEKNRIQMQLLNYTQREKFFEQQISTMKTRIADLEKMQTEVTAHTHQNVPKHNVKKFHLDRSIEVCEKGGCRVMDYNPWFGILIASQKSNTFFSGFGIRKIDTEKFQTRQFILLHNEAIRDMGFSTTKKELLLSVGFDKCAKLMDIRNNSVVQNYETEYALWSCCWSSDNPHMFFVGAQNGSITQFDTRQLSGPVETLDNPGDRSPVVSLASIPFNPGSGISRGGFIACRLNSCYAYEHRESKYTPKQIYLDGPFVSVCYDEKNNHTLISSRPNARQRQPMRHIVCTIEKGNDDSTICNVVHTFHAGNSQQYLSRPCYVNVEDDTLVAAHQESQSNISLWSVSSGKQVNTLPVSDPVVDLCSINVNDNLYLATLSAKKVRIYCHG